MFSSMFSLDINTSIIIGVVFVIAYLALRRRDTKYKLPPGPIPLPIIGTIYGTLFFKLENAGIIKQRFGDVVLFYSGSIRVVMLNSIEAAKEAFISNAQTLSDRGAHISYTNRCINPNRKGILASDYHATLRQNRSSSLTIFRNLGVGRSTMEERIMEEGERLYTTIKDKNGKEFDPWHIIGCSVANVILSVVLSKQYTHDDPEFLQVMKDTDDMISIGKHSQLIDSINFLRFLPPYKNSLKTMISSDDGMINYMWKSVKEHMKHFQAGQANDFVDSWIDRNYDPQSQLPKFDEEDFKFLLRDLLIAGTETTATSLKWTIIHLANNPKIQAKLHEEIDREIGKERPICLNDRDQLPYMEAFALEVQRTKTVVPFSLPHYTKVDAKIGGYDIPANTVIGLNLAGIHMDPETFEKPREFRPERFIDCEGKFTRHPNVIQFGIGKRSCLGELLARQELFIFTAILAQRFTFLCPEGKDKIDDEGIQNFTYCPKRFIIRAIPR